MPGIMSYSTNLAPSAAPSASTPLTQHFIEPEFDMELTYITENLIALCFPDDGSEVTYRQNAKEVSDMLRAKHGDRYSIINLSAKSRILEQNNKKVFEFGFPPQLAPSLESLCNVCRTVATWLQTSKDNVIVFHCKGSVDRLACVLAAYINFSAINDKLQALNRIAMKQFFDEQLAKWLQPSQARYVLYFTHLLLGRAELRNEPLFLQHIMLHGIPKGSSTASQMRVFVRIYANLRPIYASNILPVAATQSRVCVSLPKPLQLQGDILIKVYNKGTDQRETICRLQFNSAIVSDERLILSKPELDVASSDNRFVEDGRLELIFCAPQSQFCEEEFSPEAKSDHIVRWDSYANLNAVIDDSPLNSPSGQKKAVRVSKYFEDGPLEDSLYNSSRPLQKMPSQSNGTMYSAVPGNEYGITNVSSHGRVNITVIPPNKVGYWAQQSPSLYDSQSQVSSTQHRNLSSGSSSPRSPLNNNIESTTTNYSTSTKRSFYKTHDVPAADRTEQPLPLKAAPSGKEQNDLDEILRELLGDSNTARTTTTKANKPVTEGESAYRTERQEFMNPDGSTTTIERRVYKSPSITENITVNKTSSLKASSQVSTTTNGISPEVDESGLSWLEQQQLKLNQRQKGRDDVDTSLRRKHEQQTISEIRTTQNRRQLSSNDIEQADGSVYRTQKDIIVQHQPVAYTVLIRPEEEKKRQQEIKQQTESSTNVSKKSVTNVSHTHHNHYNFKDSDSDSEQREKIKRLEEELRNVKLNLQNSTVKKEQEKKVETKPPRPPKQQELEEEEILSFKPVGIASLESGTGATIPRVIPGPPSAATVYEEEEVFGFKPVGINTLESGTGQTYAQQSNTMKSGFNNTIRSQPQSQYGSSSGGGQKVITESRHYQQTYSSGAQASPLSPSTAMNQGGQQSYVQQNDSMSNSQPVTVGGQNVGGQENRLGGQSYNYSTHAYHTNSSGGRGGGFQGGYNTMTPHDQVLHVNTGESQYATIGGNSSGGQGHMQFNNMDTSGMANHSASMHNIRSGAGYNSYGGTMGGSRYYMNQPPLSPSAVSFYNQPGASSNVYHHNTGPPSVYHGVGYGSRRGSMQSLVAASDAFGENSLITAKFVKDTSKYWYKPNISRDEVISQLKDAVPGTFIVRDSSSFPGSFGLAVKVAQLPPNVQIKPGTDASSEYVRFYLIEPTAKGVKLKGCTNEPVFASLAALIYQHTITPLALPCKLLLPDQDRMTSSFAMAFDQADGPMGSPSMTGDSINSASQLLKSGAACQVVYLNNVDTESLTGPQAISKAVQQTFSKGKLDTTVATFKVSADGITVTDTYHRLFFRQHFPRESVSFCGIDPADRRFTQNLENGAIVKEAKMFGFVAKKKKGGNNCLLFAELDPDQPASAIVNFVTKVMMGK